MKNPANDNHDPWNSIGLAAALILVKLRTQQQINDAAEREACRDSDQRNGCENLRAKLSVGR
jgi:hypothetical protein